MKKLLSDILGLAISLAVIVMSNNRAVSLMFVGLTAFIVFDIIMKLGMAPNENER
jgi:hypothetical protein